MKTLEEIVNEACKGVTIHLPESEEPVIECILAEKLKHALAKKYSFNEEEFHEEAHALWLNKLNEFKFVYKSELRCID